MPEEKSTSTASFKYTGPTSGVTLRHAGGKPIEVMLFSGKVVELPTANAHVGKLIAQGYLTAVAEEPQAAPVKAIPAVTSEEEVKQDDETKSSTNAPERRRTTRSQTKESTS